MADDFRTLLKEQSRSEKFGRWFKEINVRGTFRLSVQASDAHDSIPPEVLDDVYKYEAFELALEQTYPKPLYIEGYGAWSDLEQKPWAKYFERGEISGLKEARKVPVAVVQEIYEDLIAWADSDRR